MAVVAGTRYSTTDSANVAIDMSDTLTMITPSDVPFLQLIGRSSLSTPCVATKHEWLEDALRPLDSAIATVGEFTGTGAVSTATFTAGQGVYFRAGDILLIESELCLLTSVTTDTIAIAAGGRGYGGSTAAAHVTLTPIKLIGNVLVQDGAVGASRTLTKSGLFNYVQLMEDSVKLTTTELAIKKYVEQNSLDAQLTKALKTWWVLWERTLLYGRKVQPTSTVAGAMDGVLVRISSNSYAKAGAYLIEDHLRTALRDIWIAGGSPSHVIANAFQKERLSTFLDGQRQTTRTDQTAGSVIKQYESEYGDVRIILDRNMPTDTVLVVSKDNIGFGPFSQHATRAEEIAQTTGTVRTYQILGAYTAELRAEASHAKITGLATS